MQTEPRFAHVRLTLGDLNLAPKTGEEELIERVENTPIDSETYEFLSRHANAIDVSDEFKKVVDYFATPAGHTPAGFRKELGFSAGVVTVDLVRDIGCDQDGRERPTNVLFSADSANPYEVAPIAPFLSNLTCNPGIIYDLFLNNPQANVGGKFKDRDEVITELGRVLGPGCDISVELNNPFEPDFSKILDEAARFRDILSPWRVVIKVPHTGPVNAANVEQLLEGDKRLDTRYSAGTTEDRLRGHNLALKLSDAGYRVNFTLMFEPYQTQMALQAKPYFINSFVRHRKMQSERIAGLLAAYDASGSEDFLKELRTYMVSTDYLSKNETGVDLFLVESLARAVLHQRGIVPGEDLGDGLDAVRHSLRALRQANLPETRLIICSMEGEYNYPDLDRLLLEDEFADMARRVVVTAEPQYLARFTSANQVVSYQRRFMNAANGQA
ncbi:MAG: hypothetical protein LKI28_03545 [Ancrocorticia sp.]|jgi:hypothetical protein|nr:hypothetical protein [Ancrocorticia sp.]